MAMRPEAESEQRCLWCTPPSIHDDLFELHLHCLSEHKFAYHLSDQLEANERSCRELLPSVSNDTDGMKRDVL